MHISIDYPPAVLTENQKAEADIEVTTCQGAPLAPFFCIGYFYANRKPQLTAIILTLGIIMLVVLVHYCPQPWRGIIDFGVVLGLT